MEVLYLADPKKKDLTCNFCGKIAGGAYIKMLYELYKLSYFNLYDFLITGLLYCPLIIIFKFIKLFFKNVSFTSIMCTLALCT